MKRFDCKGHKIGDNVSLPLSFSIANFKSESIDRMVIGTNSKVPLTDSKPNNVKVEDSEVFDLYAFTTHEGSNTSSGHYISVVKGLNDQWYECNDKKIT
jgi:uncharacterized UBP type Zn finger protein